MILIISNAQDVTADFLQKRLLGAGVEHARLNTERLAHIPLSFASDSHEEASFVLDGRRISLSEIDSIYYRRPVPPEFPSDVQLGVRDWMENETRRAWGGILAARSGIRWMNHPLAVSRANYKPEQLARARRFGLRVPSTLITTEPEAAKVFCEGENWNVVVKPVGHGEIIGRTESDDRVVYTNLLTSRQAICMQSVTSCPTLFQTVIQKGMDLRVTIAGNDLVTVALHSQERDISRIDCRRDNMSGMRYTVEHLPDSLNRRLLELVRSYELLYAAIDLVSDANGEYWFLEINPAGQWAWLEQETNAPISDAIIRCLTGSR